MTMTYKPELSCFIRRMVSLSENPDFKGPFQAKLTGSPLSIRWNTEGSRLVINKGVHTCTGAFSGWDPSVGVGTVAISLSRRVGGVSLDAEPEWAEFELGDW